MKRCSAKPPAVQKDMSVEHPCGKTVSYSRSQCWGPWQHAKERTDRKKDMIRYMDLMQQQYGISMQSTHIQLNNTTDDIKKGHHIYSMCLSYCICTSRTNVQCSASEVIKQQF